MLPPIPSNESERLAALDRFQILDTDPEPAFERVTRLASTVLGMPIALVSLVDEKRQWFKSRIGIPVSETPREDAFCAHAINSKDIFVVPDATKDERFVDNPLVVGPPGIRFYAGAPLATEKGACIGTVCVIDQKPRTLTDREEATLRDLAAIAMSELEARQAVGYVHPLTGLPNRMQLFEDIQGVIDDPTLGGQGLSLVLIEFGKAGDFDEFGRVLGHQKSDAAVAAVARRIIDLLPRKTKLYQVADSRFAFVIPEGSVPSELLNHVAEGLDGPIACEEVTLTMQVAIGISQYPEDATTARELLRCSLIGVNDSRHTGKPWSRYDASHDAAQRRAFAILSDLSAALTGPGQLHLHFQPKIELRTDTCIGAEALVRWHHPGFGAINPAEFVPLLERTGHVSPLTTWVIDAAVHQIVSWRESGFHPKIAINISMLDLQDDTFAESLRQRLHRHGIAPSSIEIEVTESALVDNPEKVRLQLHEIRDLGIAIAIDDFGTGQSAHSYLKMIPATSLKIDQSFVRSIQASENDRAIVESMLDLAHRVGCSVVAEGIEDDDTRTWLTERGCEYGQGYLISKPLSPEAFLSWEREAHLLRWATLAPNPR